MNQHTHIRMSTLLGTVDGNSEVHDRHIDIHDIPNELMWQVHHCLLAGDIKVMKLTINPEVEQPEEAKRDDEPGFFPVYGVPDLSRFYDED